MTSSQVNYVARCGNLRGERDWHTRARCGSLKVISGYDYLWINVRVKGGAYGVHEWSSDGSATAISFPTAIRTCARRMRFTRASCRIWSSLRQTSVI